VWGQCATFVYTISDSVLRISRRTSPLNIVTIWHHIYKIESTTNDKGGKEKATNAKCTPTEAACTARRLSNSTQPQAASAFIIFNMNYLQSTLLCTIKRIRSKKNNPPLSSAFTCAIHFWQFSITLHHFRTYYSLFLQGHSQLSALFFIYSEFLLTALWLWGSLLTSKLCCRCFHFVNSYTDVIIAFLCPALLLRICFCPSASSIVSLRTNRWSLHI